MEHWWKDIGRAKPKDSKQNLSNAILSTTNLTCTNKGSKPDLHGNSRSTNRLSHGTTTEDKKVLFCPILSNFRKGISFWKVPKLCAFVLLVRATCRRRRV